MEDSSNEKVKHEKQRRNIVYMLFGQYVYIYIYIYCNLCIELFIYILLLKFASYFSHLALKLFLEMPI